MLACEELDETRGLRIGVRQVDLDIAARLCGLFACDPDVIAAMTIVVQECLAVEHAVLPCRDHRPRLMLRNIQDGLYRRFNNRRAEFHKQPG